MPIAKGTASLRHQVQIQQLIEVSDTFGGAGTQQWQTVPGGLVWGAVEPASVREYITAQQMAAEATTTIRIRYHPGITPKMRVLYGTRTYDIQGIIDVDERHIEMRLICIERNL
jgi:SPP1 family predicted phage head-tail adaptor